MDHLADTGVLLRFSQRAQPEHALARDALRRLRRAGHRICVVTQNMAEFWCVATRPASARGGFGLTVQEADRAVRLLERLFHRLPDTDEAYGIWRALLTSNAVSGVAAHDARIVAAMIARGLTRIITFDPADFDRYPGITVVHPQTV